MSGRHDRGAEEPGLVATGPIVVRGLSRGVRAALSTSRPGRHRSVEQADPQDDGLLSEDAGRLEADDGTIDRADGLGEEREMAAPLDQSEPDRDSDRSAAPPRQPVPAPDERRTFSAGLGSDAPARGEDLASTDVPARPVEADDAFGMSSDEGAAQTEGDDLHGHEAKAREDEIVPSHPLPPSRTSDQAALRVERSRRPAGSAGLRGAIGRRVRGVDRAAAGVAGLVVLALLCAGLIAAVIVKTQNDAATATGEAAAYTPPALDASASPAGPVVPIISDATATSGADALTVQQRWPALLGDAIEGDAVLLAEAGSGYTRGGAERLSFADEAARVPADADVVVFVGGAADVGSSALALARAATQAFAAARDRAPDAKILVVGPLFEPSQTTGSDFDDLRTALRSAARIVGARWVDPVDAGWLDGVSDASDLTAAKERIIARRLAVEIAALRS